MERDVDALQGAGATHGESFLDSTLEKDLKHL